MATAVLESRSYKCCRSWQQRSTRRPKCWSGEFPFEGCFADYFQYLFFFNYVFQQDQDEFNHVKCKEIIWFYTKIVFTSRSNIQAQLQIVMRFIPGKVMRNNTWIVSATMCDIPVHIEGCDSMITQKLMWNNMWLMSTTVCDFHVQQKVVMQCSPRKVMWSNTWIILTTRFDIHVQLTVMVHVHPGRKSETTCE